MSLKGRLAARWRKQEGRREEASPFTSQELRCVVFSGIGAILLFLHQEQISCNHVQRLHLCIALKLQCEHNRLRGDAELLHRPAPAEGGLAHRQRRRARVLLHYQNPQVGTTGVHGISE